MLEEEIFAEFVKYNEKNEIEEDYEIHLGTGDKMLLNQFLRSRIKIINQESNAPWEKYDWRQMLLDFFKMYEITSKEIEAQTKSIDFENIILLKMGKQPLNYEQKMLFEEMKPKGVLLRFYSGFDF